MSDIAHSLGGIAVAMLVVGLALIPILWPYSPRNTFSQHIARHRSSTLYYIVLFSTFLPLFLIFFLVWFIPYFHLPTVTVWAIIIVALTQYACTFIPETKGWRRRWHRVLAAGSAFALIPIVAIMSVIPSTLINITVYCSLIIMIILPIIFLVPRFRVFGESYWIQAVYYAAFFTPVMIAAYVVV